MVKYQKIQKLGEGTFSKVKLVKVTNTEEYCALKKQKKQVKSLSTWKREIRALKILANHPRFCKLLDAHIKKDESYIVMEYASGGDLIEYIMKNGKIEPSFALCIFKELIEAIQYMHSAGVVHRDLKPENILLDDEFHIKIGDLGAALETRDN